MRLEGVGLALLGPGLALVKVRVKYCTSSMFQTEMIMVAWMASLSGRGFSLRPSLDGEGREVPFLRSEMIVSTETSCTVVRAKLDLLSFGREGLEDSEFGLGVDVGVL